MKDDNIAISLYLFSYLRYMSRGSVSVVHIAKHTSAARHDWLGYLINITKLLQNASDLTPFPFIGQAACIVVIHELRVFQQVKKNKDDFQDLAESIVDIIMTVRNEALARETIDWAFHDSCRKLIEYLAALLEELTQASRKNRNWIKQFLKSNQLRDAIVRYEKRLTNLRANFMLGTTIGMRINFQNRQGEIVKPKYDALDREVELVSQNFHCFMLGDLVLLEQRGQQHLGFVGNDSKVFSSEYAAAVHGETKTVRLYEGSRAIDLWLSDLRRSTSFRHPNVLQLFGICKSLESPALVFHGHHTTTDKYRLTLDPYPRLQFWYRMVQDYQAAWSYLRRWLPHCESTSESPSTTFYDIGCSCNFPADHFSETLVNESGKICVSISHARAISPRMVTQAHYTTSFPNPLPPLVKGIQKPSQTNRASWTDIKPDILDLFRIAATISRPVDAISDVHVAIYDLQVPSHHLLSDGGYCSMHMSSPGRLLVTPPIPYQSMASQWRPKSSLASVCYISEGWSRLSLTRHEFVQSITTDIIGVDPSRLLVSWLIFASSLLKAAQLSPNPLQDAGLLWLTSIVTGVQGLVDASASFASDSPDVVYLFVSNLRIGNQGVVHHPYAYWSLDPSGRQRLTEDEISRQNLALAVKVDLQTHGFAYPEEAYSALGDLCRSYATHLDADEIFGLLGLPPTALEFLPNIRSSMGVDARRGYFDPENYDMDICEQEKYAPVTVTHCVLR